MDSCYCIYNSVCAYFTWIFIFNIQASFYPRPNYKRFNFKIFFTHTL